MAALRLRGRLALLASLVSIALVAFGAATASADLVTYPARLHVAGGLTITTKHDFTASCQPGQAWTIAASADVEINGKIEVEANGKRIVQSTEAKSPGGAVHRSVLSEYRETNYCAPEDPVELPRPPRCSSHTGAGVAGLQPDGRNKAPWFVSIGIGRVGGGDQDTSCTGQPVNGPTPKGSKIEPLASVYDSIVLPLNLKVSQFKSLAVGKKLISRVNVGGPCDSAVAYGGAHISVFRDDECEVDGVFNVEIKRLKGQGRGGFTTARAG